MFMIKGVTVLFRVAITLFQLMEKEILKCRDYCDIFMMVEKYGLSVSVDVLLKNLYTGIKSRDIEQYRAKFRIEVFDLLTEQLDTQEAAPTKNPNKRLEFLSKFLLY